MPFHSTVHERLNFCPSPVGKGSQAISFKILLMEKLLNETPSVPVKPIPPPHPAESSKLVRRFFFNGVIVYPQFHHQDLEQG